MCQFSRVAYICIRNLALCEFVSCHLCLKGQMRVSAICSFFAVLKADYVGLILVVSV